MTVSEERLTLLCGTSILGWILQLLKELRVLFEGNDIRPISVLLSRACVISINCGGGGGGDGEPVDSEPLILQMEEILTL